MTVYNGKLIVGGYFSTAGGNPASSIAAWDGTSWTPLGSGMDGDVAALTVYNGKLIAVGSFSHAGGVAASNVAQWDGTSWSPLGSGTNSDTYTATIYNGELVVGGRFTEAGGIQASNIARWNGTSWNPLGTGTTGFGYLGSFVYTMTVYNSNLYAAGIFSQAGGLSASNIARWDGAAWSPLGSGIREPNNYSQVFWITSDQSTLYAGGYFFVAGERTAADIAAWSDADPTGVPHGGPRGFAAGGGQLELESNAPNPFERATSIPYVLGRSGPIQATIFDPMGRRVRTLIDGVGTAGFHVIEWKGDDDRGSAVAPGVYFTRFIFGGETGEVKLLKIR
jgi:hypothetical protein